MTRAVYWRQTYRVIARIRSSLTAQIYRQTTDLRGCDVTDSAAVTLMRTDVERIVDALAQFHELWASCLEVGVATWLLARQISYAALVPLVVCVGEYSIHVLSLYVLVPLPSRLILLHSVCCWRVSCSCSVWTCATGLERTGTGENRSNNQNAK